MFEFSFEYTRKGLLLMWEPVALSVILAQSQGSKGRQQRRSAALLNQDSVLGFLFSSAIYIAVGLGVWSLLGLFHSDQQAAWSCGADRRAVGDSPRMALGCPARPW